MTTPTDPLASSARKPRLGRAQAVADEEWLDGEFLRCADDPERFNRVILAAPAFWSRQRELSRSFVECRHTCAPTGNGVGKTWLLARLALWAFHSHPGCKVVVSAPTLGQLRGAVWGEIGKAIRSAESNGFPLGGRVGSETLEHDESWRLECFGQGSVESKSGRHAADLFALIDEASGTPRAVDEAIDSLNPSRILRLGNPLRPEGKFYEACQLSADNPHINVVRIPSLESPDIHLPRSPRGMADATWLESVRHEYGEGSIWWLSHVLAQFPNEITEGLLAVEWLNEAARILYVPAGSRWLAVDIAEGNAGDESGILGRDDNGILRDEAGLAWECSNRWSMETLAERVRSMADRFDVEPGHIVYDAGGPGADFDNRLRAVGLSGCYPYKGNRLASPELAERYANLRTAAAWQLRKRLDPKRPVRAFEGKRPVWRPRQPFALPPELLNRYRAELQGARYRLAGDAVELEPKAELVKRIKRSPTFLDCWIMSYALPYR